VGIGVRDALWPDRPSLELLDAATGPAPAYLINADVHSMWLNSAALQREHLDSDDGMLREDRAFEVSRRLAERNHRSMDLLLDEWLRAVAARGVVGIVDLEMAWNPDRWRRRAERTADPVRVRCSIYPDALERAIGAGMRTGDPLTPDGRVTVGPLKVITDGSLGTRSAACSQPYPGGGRGELTVPPPALRALLGAAEAAGLECAVHAIGDVAVSHALDAFAVTGAQGTIEHAQLVAHADLARFGRSGIDAGLQPKHALDDRDVADREWAGQTAMVYPLRSLADAGIGLRFGSDAPVAAADPWVGIAAAVHRRRAGEPAWHPEEALDAMTALAASGAGGTRHASAIAVGAPADLVLIGADPVTSDAARLAQMPVLATLVAGRLTHRS
jgi:predicted amidohydrolase YtcJ